MLVNGDLESILAAGHRVPDPDDFDAFWARTLAESDIGNVTTSVTNVALALESVEIYDVTFSGFQGSPVRAWLKAPSKRSGVLPVVVEYVGYGGGRGHPLDNLAWAASGSIHIVMDTRGQGSGWSQGQTPDDFGSGPQHPGFLTRGIQDRNAYYYRRLIVDAVRAIDVAKECDFADPAKISVFGISQGGGIALAVTGLVSDLSSASINVPFLCDIQRSVETTDEWPYRELRQYFSVHPDLIDDCIDTLSYFDGVNFAKRGRAPARFSLALMDQVCPPLSVASAFKAYNGEKELQAWRFNGHEAGGTLDIEQSMSFFKSH